MNERNNLRNALELFRRHYEERLGECGIEALKNKSGIHTQCFIQSAKLKKGNSPRIFYHGKKGKDVIVLTHGLSDSPWYVEAIAKRFYAEGSNVLLPLLPAHGLKDPNEAMEDFKLDRKWREEIDRAVEVAALLGERISLGGFSTGGALSYNKILRHPAHINGGLFLFAGGLDIGQFNEFLGNFSLIQKIVKLTDGEIIGIGQDPFKYPTFPNFGGIELAQIINENETLSRRKKITQPVFAAHSIHDKTANIEGILELMKTHVEIGSFFLISANVRHPETPLEVDVPLDSSQELKPEHAPKANPQFEEMMAAALHFFRKWVQISGISQVLESED